MNDRMSLRNKVALVSSGLANDANDAERILIFHNNGSATDRCWRRSDLRLEE